ncbi:MAG: thermonuclease family protein [Henriciella sp.]
MVRALIFFGLLLLPACAPSSPLPNMQPGETGRVTRIIDGDALVLDTGQSVRLVSIEAPAMYPESGVPAPHAGESARRLEDMALGRRVQLYYPGLTRDRYDRALAHVVTIDGAGPKLWLNREMIEAGAAWVRLYPSTAARGRELLDHEAAARSERRGLWARSDYAVWSADQITPDANGFFFVRGVLGATAPVPADTRYPPACLRGLEGATLLLAVRKDAGTACGLADGTEVFIRGRVSGGELDLSHPFHLSLEASN